MLLSAQPGCAARSGLAGRTVRGPFVTASCAAGASKAMVSAARRVEKLLPGPLLRGRQPSGFRTDRASRDRLPGNPQIAVWIRPVSAKQSAMHLNINENSEDLRHVQPVHLPLASSSMS